MRAFTILRAIFLRALIGFTLTLAGNAMAACAQPTGVPISVVDCGADPSGATPSDSAFLSAVSAAAANSSKYVYIPCGIYTISSTTFSINIPANGFTLSGQGRRLPPPADSGCEVKVQLPSGFIGPFVNIDGKTDAAVRNFIIDGAGSDAKIIKTVPTSLAGVAANIQIAGMKIQNAGVAVLVSYNGNTDITDGLSIVNSEFTDINSSAVVLLNVKNFTFSGNKLTNWGKGRSSAQYDGINYDMTQDVSNWRVVGNQFNAGVNTSHAISQGPDHAAYQINGAVFAGNASAAGPGGYASFGAGFGIECSNCEILDNTFTTAAGSNANGWRNCLEIYGTNKVTIASNTCDAGFIVGGPTLSNTTNVSSFYIRNNTIKSVGAVGNVTISCILFGGAAHTGPVGSRTTVSDIEISGNRCDATNSATAYGTIGILVGNSAWDGINNMLISENSVKQVQTNTAIRIVGTVTSLTNLRVLDNDAPQGFQFFSQAHPTFQTVPNASSNILSRNNFGAGNVVIDESAAPTSAFAWKNVP